MWCYLGENKLLTLLLRKYDVATGVRIHELCMENSNKHGVWRTLTVNDMCRIGTRVSARDGNPMISYLVSHHRRLAIKARHVLLWNDFAPRQCAATNSHSHTQQAGAVLVEPTIQP
ncbi:hypothetical protein CEXT_370931 [Caerostris extrusa]|uniref:Uncharacterized protein n=1 Tax=Caerostris extrusa TaxID=172846 RepID=A0AAV4TWV0_CAEEX|nr:hypothetical protein CEXT_370931 [Caerostris extrusa]